MNIKKGFLALSLSATILTGFVSEGNVFAAGEGITRGEFVKAVVSELQISPKNQNILLPSDVKKDSPYAESVKVLRERQVVYGYPDGTFQPDQPIKKQEALIILSKILGISPAQAEKTFQAEYGITFDTKTLTNEQATKAIQQALHSDANAYDWVKQSSEVHQEQRSYRSDISQDIQMVFKENMPEMNNQNSMTMNSDVKMELNVDKGIRMTMITKFGQALPDGLSEMKMEQYIVPEGMFMQMPNPESGQLEWIKMDDAMMPFSFQQLMDMQKDSAGANQALLDSKHVFYRDLGSEIVDGKKLHKVEYRSRFTSFEEMMAVMGQSLPEELQQQMQATPINGELSLTGLMWVDEATKLPVKFSQEMTLGFANSAEQPMKQMLLKQEGNYYDFNKVEDITLPEEAKNAKSLSQLIEEETK